MRASEILSIVSVSLAALAARLPGSKDHAAMTRGRGFFYLDEKTAQYLTGAPFSVGEKTVVGVRVDADTLARIFPADGNVNPKVPKRFIQFVNGLTQGAYGQIDPTTARALIALRAAGGKLNRDALSMLLTGRVKIEGVCPDTKGVGVRALDRIVGRIGRGTVETQLSRSFGAHGFCAALGMTAAQGATNFEVTLQNDNTFTKRFFALIDNATTGQLDELFKSDTDE